MQHSDIAVHSYDWNTHLKHLEAFLARMREHDLTLHLKKCIFAKGEVKFIDHVIDPVRIDSLVNLKAPESKKQVKHILGFFGYYRQFIPDFAKLAKPLRDLTCKYVPDKIAWTDEHQKAFDLIKVVVRSKVFFWEKNRLICIAIVVIMQLVLF